MVLRRSGCRATRSGWSARAPWSGWERVQWPRRRTERRCSGPGVRLRALRPPPSDSRHRRERPRLWRPSVRRHAWRRPATAVAAPACRGSPGSRRTGSDPAVLAELRPRREPSAFPSVCAHEVPARGRRARCCPHRGHRRSSAIPRRDSVSNPAARPPGGSTTGPWRSCAGTGPRPSPWMRFRSGRRSRSARGSAPAAPPHR